MLAAARPAGRLGARDGTQLRRRGTERRRASYWTSAVWTRSATVDAATGELTCGAGASHRRGVAPRRAARLVRPGHPRHPTWSAWAARSPPDVHGKNHHRDGSIGAHSAPAGTRRRPRRRCAPSPHATSLFWATVGGMGLTGVITSVTLRMIPVSSAWMAVDTWRTADLDETMQTLDRLRRPAPLLGRLDRLPRPRPRLGRGVVTAGDHLPAERSRCAARQNPLSSRPPRRQLPAPRGTSRCVGRDPGGGVQRALPPARAAAGQRSPHATAPSSSTRSTPSPDGIALYGARGFVQYQFVTPIPADRSTRILTRCEQARAPGLLAVLKRFGPANRGTALVPGARMDPRRSTFPPARPDSDAVLDAADRIVLESGGRVYLAKDARVAAGRVRRDVPARPRADGGRHVPARRPAWRVPLRPGPEAAPVIDALGAAQSLLVLGATSDIAAATVTRLAAAGRLDRVVLAARSPRRAARAGRPACARSASPTSTTRRVRRASDPVGVESGGRERVSTAATSTSSSSRSACCPTSSSAWPNRRPRSPACRSTSSARRRLPWKRPNALRAQGHGVLVVLSSVAAERPRQSNFVYGAAKAGLDALCRRLAEDLRGTGVSVLVVRPGFVRRPK